MGSTSIIHASKALANVATIHLVSGDTKPSIKNPSKDLIALIDSQVHAKNSQYYFQHDGTLHIVVKVEAHKSNANYTNEACRKAGHGVCGLINKMKVAKMQVLNETTLTQAGVYFAEGLALSNYQFIKYYKDVSKKYNSLTTITVVADAKLKKEIDQMNIVCASLYTVRDMVNEPVASFNSVDLGKLVQSSAKKYGFKAEVWDKKKIQAKKFGGLLAVNQGSNIPPTFSILEWKPAKAKNKKPIVLVGKGVVYDTGGLSLKPTGNSMDYMKCDMTGAATVLGTFIALAQAKLDLHVIGLIPSTDNRINGNEYTPGDVVKMHNGLFVEVLNTDAEGRMILADALSWADNYNPELVVDIATLTGAAARAIGHFGHGLMGNADEKVLNEFKQAGEEVYERCVELPFWDEYGDLMKSSIADLKNVGGADGGAMTAGKFLENFTKAPYVHNDIAGCSFAHGEVNYRGKGGTGYGMRYLFQFLKNRAK